MMKGKSIFVQFTVHPVKQKIYSLTKIALHVHNITGRQESHKKHEIHILRCLENANILPV